MKNFLILIFLFSFKYLVGQDSFYSNPLAASLYLNPARTGFIGGERNIRFGSIARNQWSNVGKRFSSNYLELNSRLDPGKQLFSLGLGGYINTNNQGVGNLRNTQASFSASAILANDPKKSKTQFIFSFGLSRNWHTISLDASDLLFNDQIITGASISREFNNINSFQRVNETSVSGGINLSAISNGHLSFFKKDFDFENKFSIGGAINNISRNGNISILNDQFPLEDRINFLIFNEFLLKSSKDNYVIKVDLFILSQSQLNFRQQLAGIVVGPTIYWLTGNRGVQNINYKRFIEFGFSSRGILNYLNPDEFNYSLGTASFGFSNDESGLKFGFSYDFAFPNNPVNNFTNGAQEIYLKMNGFSRLFNIGNKSKSKKYNGRPLKCPNW